MAAGMEQIRSHVAYCVNLIIIDYMTYLANNSRSSRYGRLSSPTFHCPADYRPRLFTVQSLIVPDLSLCGRLSSPTFHCTVAYRPRFFTVRSLIVPDFSLYGRVSDCGANLEIHKKTSTAQNLAMISSILLCLVVYLIVDTNYAVGYRPGVARAPY